MTEAGATFETEEIRSMHKHNLPSEQGMDLVDILTVIIEDSVKVLAHPYTFHTTDGVSANLGNMFSSGVFALDIKAMLSLSTASGSSQGHRAGQVGSGNDTTEVQHSAMPVYSGRHVVLRVLNLPDYSYEKIWHSANQNAGPRHPKRDVYAAHCWNREQSFCIHHFDYGCNIMTVALSSVSSPDGVTVSEAVEKSAGRRVVKQGFKIVNLDGHPRC